MNQLVSWFTHFICQRDFIIGITGSYLPEVTRSIAVTFNNSTSQILICRFAANSSVAVAKIYGNTTVNLKFYPQSLIIVSGSQNFTPIGDYSVSLILHTSTDIYQLIPIDAPGTLTVV